MNQDELEHVAAETRAERAEVEWSINVCLSAGCQSAQAEAVFQALQAAVDERGWGQRCKVRGVGCLGPCAGGPCVALEPAGTLYGRVQPADAPALVESLAGPSVNNLRVPTDTPFFTRQRKIVLENSGQIDPTHIEEYIAAGGYSALLHALQDLDPAAIVQEVIKSGLRGRGGAGYPTGLKWSTVAKATGTRKFVVCNADEGDPGAFMDRAVLESDPHRVLEGMAIAAYAVGATHGYIYVRAEYPLAIKRLELALRQATKAGLLGRRIGRDILVLRLHRCLSREPRTHRTQPVDQSTARNQRNEHAFRAARWIKPRCGPPHISEHFLHSIFGFVRISEHFPGDRPHQTAVFRQTFLNGSSVSRCDAM